MQNASNMSSNDRRDQDLEMEQHKQDAEFEALLTGPVTMEDPQSARIALDLQAIATMIMQKGMEVTQLEDMLQRMAEIIQERNIAFRQGETDAAQQKQVADLMEELEAIWHVIQGYKADHRRTVRQLLDMYKSVGDMSMSEVNKGQNAAVSDAAQDKRPNDGTARDAQSGGATMEDMAEDMMETE
ncbi:hypothetical protein J3F83DRAFT_719742 [Trichoderma novae-zelandiae]